MQEAAQHDGKDFAVEKESYHSPKFRVYGSAAELTAVTPFPIEGGGCPNGWEDCTVS